MNCKINLTEAEERTAIEAAKNGDSDAFESLFKEHRNDVYNLAFRMLGNEEDAKDAVQDTVINVYKGLSSFKFDSKFATWLHRIAVNSCINAQKRRESGMNRYLDRETRHDANGDPIDDWIEQLPDPSNEGPDRQAENSELGRVIYSAINLLRPRLREAFLLFSEGDKHREIAQKLNISEASSKKDVHLARQLLMKHLSQYLDF